MERGLGAVPALRLRCKKEIWEGKERKRMRQEMVTITKGKEDERLAGIADGSK